MDLESTFTNYEKQNDEVHDSASHKDTRNQRNAKSLYAI